MVSVGCVWSVLAGPLRVGGGSRRTLRGTAFEVPDPLGGPPTAVST